MGSGAHWITAQSFEQRVLSSLRPIRARHAGISPSRSFAGNSPSGRTSAQSVVYGYIFVLSFLRLCSCVSVQGACRHVPACMYSCRRECGSSCGLVIARCTDASHLPSKEIQNAALGEHRIRDLNDEINKDLREKGYWEEQRLSPSHARVARARTFASDAPAFVARVTVVLRQRRDPACMRSHVFSRVPEAHG